MMMPLPDHPPVSEIKCVILGSTKPLLVHRSETRRPMKSRSKKSYAKTTRAKTGRPLISLLLTLALISCASGRPQEDSTPTMAETRKFTRATQPLDPTTARAASADFLEGPGRLMTIAQCTGCHSGALVRQYRSTRTGWQNLIRWMQKNQGLWALDPTIENEILDYLSTRYGRSLEADDQRRPPIPDHLMPPGASRSASGTHAMLEPIGEHPQ